MQSLYTVAFYESLNIKNDETIKFSGKWVELEHIVWSAVTEAQKDKCSIFYPIVVLSSKSLGVSI